MSFNHAIIFIKALFYEYYNDVGMDIHIKKMQLGTEACNEE